jgi:predicted anti-sigma-YlaC factor YlaD
MGGGAMRCAMAERFISRRVDGRLPAADLRSLDEHLAGCGACRRLAEQMAGAWDLLGAAPPPAPASPTWATVISRLDERGRWRAWLETLGWRRPAFGLAAASMAVVVGLGIGGGLLLAGRLQSRPEPAQPFEVVAMAEAFGELPAGSPAESLLGTITGNHGGRQGR